MVAIMFKLDTKRRRQLTVVLHAACSCCSCCPHLLTFLQHRMLNQNGASFSNSTARSHRMDYLIVYFEAYHSCWLYLLHEYVES